MASPINADDSHRIDRHLLDAMVRHARTRAADLAIGDSDGRSMTWGELAIAVDRRSLELIGCERVICEIHNTMDDVISSLACLAAGVVEIAVDARFSIQARREMIRRSRGVVRSPSSESLTRGTSMVAAIDRLAERSNLINVHQGCLVLWTSGTTSRPRGVMLSPRNLIANAGAKLRAVPQNIGDHRWTVLPISHAYARTCDMGTWLISGCQWTIDCGSDALDRIMLFPDPARIPTHINCVPSIARMILDRLRRGDPRLARLRVLGCGGAAMTKEVFEQFKQYGVEVVQGYGCTETSPVIFSASPGSTRAGCVGSLVDGWESQIREGRLFVRGESLMLGYLDEPEATAQKIDADGWFDTGDLVREIGEGQFQILGRADDVIVLDNGFKIHPQRIEAVLNQFPAVQHAVVFATGTDLVIAAESKPSDHGEVRSMIQEQLAKLLPPGTRRRVVWIDPPLSYVNEELTAKGTVRRSAVVARLLKTENKRTDESLSVHTEPKPKA